MMLKRSPSGLINSYQQNTDSLYVGNLDPNITESMLFEKFSCIGSIRSIHIRRDPITYRSLGYAYVNFLRRCDAERALNSLNCHIMKHKPIRVMWYQPDPLLRKISTGNIFVKNLDKFINDKDLHHLFFRFGAISSCKVARDENGRSKGYGYVRFTNEETAKKAIELSNGLILPSGKKLLVDKFLTYEERSRKELNKHLEMFTKDLSNDSSVDPSTVSKTEENSIENKLVEAKLACVGELEEKLKELNINQKYMLYIKNLDDSIDDETLKKEFLPFGSVTNAKVIMENGRSKGFGFVCFSSEEEASNAQTVMCGRIIGNKVVYVKREDDDAADRKRRLTLSYMERIEKMRLQQQENKPYLGKIKNLPLFPKWIPPLNRSMFGRGTSGGGYH